MLFPHRGLQRTIVISAIATTLVHYVASRSKSRQCVLSKPSRASKKSPPTDCISSLWWSIEQQSYNFQYPDTEELLLVCTLVIDIEVCLCVDLSNAMVD